MAYEKLKSDLQKFYFNHLKESRQPEYRHPFEDEMDKKAEACDTVYQLKAMQYEVMADCFEPVLFNNLPFFYEMGTREAQCDGAPGISHPGAWLYKKNRHIMEETNPRDWHDFCMQREERLYLICGPFVDVDHHCFPMTNIIENGLEGVYENTKEQLKACKTEEETEFIKCALRGLLAVKKIAEKFADKASSMLKSASTPEQKKCFEMIAESAKRCPWKKPESFYEGLNTLWFLRDVTGSIEGIGQNTFGRPDKILYKLYCEDIKSGRITREEAFDLICKFLIIADCHDNQEKIMEGYSDHEYELTLTLGGCDKDGNEVYNELTEMFLTAHREQQLIYPKFKCRFSANSSKQYLAEINKDIINGRSVVLLINDDSVIPALVKSGKSLEDARNYICSGCWDITVEGCEKIPCGEYVNIARALEMSVYNQTEKMQNANIYFEGLDNAKSFEDVYRITENNLVTLLETKSGLAQRNGKYWGKLNPCPFYSSAMTGCIENRKDYTNGGAKYNQGSMYLVGFANVIDSLLSIKKLCFDEKACTLAELLAAVRSNWQGQEELRAKALRAPHFGDDTEESVCLAQRLHNNIYERTRDLRCERGGSFNMGYLVYSEFRFWGEEMLATPDGRSNGDFLAHGIAPSRYKKNDITTTINAISRLDFTKCAANSVVNVVLPAKNVSPALIDSFERVFATSGLQTLHLNCLNREELLDAQKHPERHRDLIVRVCGFSARFVSLSREWQDEILSRNFYE